MNFDSIMTKLLEWLSLAAVVLATWYAVWSGAVAREWSSANPSLALWWPVGAAAVFAVYCACVIAYRVATFNDCPEAAEELQREIADAKEDLKKKGIKL